jgi:hypothetical protein
MNNTNTKHLEMVDGNRATTNSSGFLLSPTVNRQRCKRGHLIRKSKKTFCDTCYDSLRYYRRRIDKGMSAFDANRRVDADVYRAGVRRRQKKYRQRWGYPDRNFSDRLYRQEAKRLGLGSREAVKEGLRKFGADFMAESPREKKGRSCQGSIV